MEIKICCMIVFLIEPLINKKTHKGIEQSSIPLMPFCKQNRRLFLFSEWTIIMFRKTVQNGCSRKLSKIDVPKYCPKIMFRNTVQK